MFVVFFQCFFSIRYKNIIYIQNNENLNKFLKLPLCMKSLVKTLKSANILFPLIFGVSLLSNPANAQKISFLKEINLGITYNKEHTKISNIPLIIRDVPKHPDDGYADDRDVAPIEDKTLKMSDRISFVNGKFGGKISFLEEKLNLNLGVETDLEFKFNSLAEYNERSDLNERNYTNHPGTNIRGEGAALTFYDVHPAFILNKNTFIKPQLFSEIEIAVKDRGLIKLGYGLYSEKLVARNGWDRWNSLEVKERYPLANLLIGKPYFSIRTPSYNNKGTKIYSESTLGFTYLINKDTKEIAKETQINFKRGWFIESSINILFNKNKNKKSK
jgi:hypothetical protein